MVTVFKFGCTGDSHIWDLTVCRLKVTSSKSTELNTQCLRYLLVYRKHTVKSNFERVYAAN